jgi:Mg/Co/Ni transporter MgtE
MSSPLIEYYLRHHPREAVSVIEQGGIQPAVDFLGSLEPQVRAQLLSCLLPTIARAYLLGARVEDAAAALDTLRASIIVSLLQSLRHSERAPILDRIVEEKREAVYHQLRYPSDSVGAIISVQTAACRSTSTVQQAKRIVRRLSSADTPLVVVVDQAMQPLGALDFGQLLRLREREIVADHMKPFAQRFSVRSAMSVVAEHSAWQFADYLPAVEHDESFVGIVSKSRLFNYLAGERSDTASADEMMQTLIALGELFWMPAADFIARATTGRQEDLQ